MTRRRGLFLSSLLGLACLLPALAQQAPSRGGFGEQVTVTVVQVPVQVFRDGEPVSGLTEEDFEVFDEGERRELSSFEVVDLTQTVDGAAPAAEAPRSEQAHRSLLVLFDLAFGDARSLERARRGIAQMIDKQLHPSDRVAIATYEASDGAQILLGFTSDRELLRAALDLLGAVFRGDRRAVASARAAFQRREAEAGGRSERDGLARLSARLGPSAALALEGRLRPRATATGSIASGNELAAAGLLGVAADGSTRLDPTVGSLAFSEASEITESFSAEANLRVEIAATRAFTEAISELVTLLRDLDGQKHLIYLSRGMSGAVIEKQAVAPFMEAMFEAFRRSGWQVQAVDLRGQPDAFGGGLHELGSPEPGPTPTIAFKGASLLYMAEGAGGEVYENFSDVSLATRRILTTTRITYVLSFSVADLPQDGRYRKLEVRLENRDGYRLEHREGYYAPKPAAERSDLEHRLDEAERLLGDGEGGELEAVAQAFPLQPDDGKAPVPFFVEVAGRSLGSVGEAARRTLRLRAFLIDESGAIAGAFDHELGIDLAQAGPAVAAHGVRFYGALVAPEGEHRLRLVVDDVEGGRSWLGALPLTVASEGQETFLAPPFFVDLAGGWFVTRYDAGSTSALYPFKVGERDVVPAVQPRLAPGDTRAVLLLLQGSVPKDLAISARVLAADGSAAGGGSFKLLSREPAAGGIQRLLASFSPAGLADGEYRLEVTAAGRGGKVSAVSEAWFGVGE